MELMVRGNCAESLGWIRIEGDWLKGLRKLGVSSATFITTFLSSYHLFSYQLCLHLLSMMTVSRALTPMLYCNWVQM